jgi:hypothetical protein
MLHPSGEAFVTTGSDGAVRLWCLATYRQLRQIQPFSHDISAGCFFDEQFVSGGIQMSEEDNNLLQNTPTVWNLSDLRLAQAERERHLERLDDCSHGIVRDIAQSDFRLFITVQKLKGIVIETFELLDSMSDSDDDNISGNGSDDDQSFDSMLY